MKNEVIQVSAGVLPKIHQNKVYLLLGQRSVNDSLPGMWEFPGGKVRQGEMWEEAVVREFKEEVGLDVLPIKKLAETTAFRGRIHLCFFLVNEKVGLKAQMKVHQALEWVRLEEMLSRPMPPANARVIPIIKKQVFEFIQKKIQSEEGGGLG